MAAKSQPPFLSPNFIATLSTDVSATQVQQGKQQPQTDHHWQYPKALYVCASPRRHRNAAAAKAAKQAADAQLKAERIACIAAAEDNLWKEDEVAKRSAQRPDLVVGEGQARNL